MNEIKKNENKEGFPIKYSSKVHLSYSLGGFLDNFIGTAFIIRVIGFYETEVLLHVILVSLAFIIYGVFNMINDPIAGYFSDRNTRFTKRWGRRFPWFAATAIPSSIIYLLIFMIPNQEAIVLFFWLLFTICLYDLLFSIWDTNWLALFPDKFRSLQERTKVGGLVTVSGLIGMTLGMVIPPLFIEYGNINSYIISALIIVLISLIVAILMFPGMREDEELIERTLRISNQRDRKDSFFATLKIAIRQKNFVVFLFIYLTLMIILSLTVGSVYYWVRYILRMQAFVEIYMSAGTIVATVVSVPIWVKLGRKYGNRKVFMYGAILIIIFYIPILIISDLISTIISIILLSFAIGSMLTLMYPFFSEIIDEIVIKTKNRQEGIYTGIRTFFGRLSFIIAALFIAIIHTLTYFQPEAEIQTPLALWGIRIIMAIIPMCFCFVTFLLLWKVNDLTPEKVLNIKNKLKEMNL